jgi:hypothetical protein
LRRHRALAAAASVAIGSIALLGATNVSAASPSSSPPSHMVGISTSEPEGPAAAPAVEPASVEPASTPAPESTPAPVVKPHPSDEVEIGDALVIERGEQPADPNTQIDNTVTYER